MPAEQYSPFEACAEAALRAYPDAELLALEKAKAHQELLEQLRASVALGLDQTTGEKR